MGYFKDLKQVRKIVLDCMNNVHPIYNIKELMIKRELAKNPELEGENWERFMPKFKKRNVQRKKIKIQPKERSPFPPEQLLRKEDYAMFSGEYHLTKEQKNQKIMDEKAKKREVKLKEKKEENLKLYDAPAEDIAPAATETAKPKFTETKPDIHELKKKFMKKKK